MRTLTDNILSITGAAFILFILCLVDGKQESLFEDKWGKISWNSVFKILDRYTILKPLIGSLNFELGKGLIIRDVLNVARLFRLHYKMSQFTPCAKHSKLDLIIVGMRSLQFKFTIEEGC